jgi:SAM-dependent methyltransferase
MLIENLEPILDSLPDDARVLDVGGWAAPLNRANYIIDAMPYETRGCLAPGSFGPGPERFSAETWVARDFCNREPWPFEDDFFDFVWCTQTLEDVRDPIWVCAEMGRVGKRGYLDVPSILEELTWQAPEATGGDWLGHEHHRWLITEEDGELVFMHKPHSIHTQMKFYVRPEWASRMKLEDRGLAQLWEGAPRARERIAFAKYPVDDLERQVLERFDPSPEELARIGREERLRELGLRVGRAAERAAEKALSLSDRWRNRRVR